MLYNTLRPYNPYLNVRALEFSDEDAVAGEDGHVKLVAVRVSDQDVARIRHVDPVRKVGHVLAPNAT